ncbi:MAG: hypothetical protein V7655_06520 [Aequorivita antarctica]
MEEYKNADNEDNALEIAFDVLNNNFNDKSGIVKIPIKKKVGVLINHSGKVGNHYPNGWNFTFQRDRGAEKWDLTHTEEF